MDHKPRILFLSTGDSTRSQIAEGFLRTFAGDDLVAVSTATRSAEADWLAHDVMKEVGIDISSQHAKEVAESIKEHFSYVVTICVASREKFPVWPFAVTSFTGVWLIQRQSEDRLNRSERSFDGCATKSAGKSGDF